jgi:glycogen(starch) synthase
VPRPSFWSKVVREIKRLSTHRAFLNIACSECLARHVGRHCVAVPNFYDETTFHPIDSIPRDGDLVFLGRLVSDKGADLAVEALHLLAQNDMHSSLTLIGDGPERAALEEQALRLGVAGQVHFAGVLKGEALARELHRHRIMVVPSRWPEPFGIVALEGIACGLAVVGTKGGGLAEAIGPCGLAVENGSATALADGIRRLLQDPSALQGVLREAPAHLARHTRRHATAEYLRLISARVQRPLP